MDNKKSLDNGLTVIAAMLCDANASHGVVFNTSALKLTLQKCERRMLCEGVGFLTKTLPRLGKRFDQALAGADVMNCASSGFKPITGTKLPRFLGEFFLTIFSKDGYLLPDPDAKSVRIVRQILAAFGKYKLPYDDEQEKEVISAFEKAEEDLSAMDDFFEKIEEAVHFDYINPTGSRWRGRKIENFQSSEGVSLKPVVNIVRDARNYLNRLFLTFDPTDIIPKHGPGAVATKQRHSGKYKWDNVSSRITSVYPYDEYFTSSVGHVCDTYRAFNRVGNKSLPARVILVPKDSRGPRLISCEPVDFQWIQGGLGSALVEHVEQHPLSRGAVNFTNQEVNRNKALAGSISGDTVTLDLKEASDRIHLKLVRLLFPESLYSYLENCRSLSTVLPCGKELPLKKFAPMGSALCFPVLALTIWALLCAAAPNEYIRKDIFVYGDDVIVPKGFSLSAIAVLELFGLKINRNKSCCSGLFRESCGMDAFNGVDVTPVKFKTVWDKLPNPGVYSSWISYANSFYDRGWMHTYEEICRRLRGIYGSIPGEDMFLTCPALRGPTHTSATFRKRWNKNLQRFETSVRDVHSVSHSEESVCGWQKLLRYFSENSASKRTLAKRLTKRS